MEMAMRRRIILVSAAAALALALPAAAQSDMEAGQLRASGAVGEQATGYMAPAPGASLSEAQRRAMDQINIQRRSFYTQKAEATGVSVAQFAQFTACEIFERLQPGEYYRDETNTWRKTGAEGAKLPSWCTKQ
jgi:uncharacterized protein YdbL (DUF1318 family)